LGKLGKAIKIVGIIVAAWIAVTVAATVVMWDEFCCAENKTSAVAVSSASGATEFDFGSDKVYFDFVDEQADQFVSGLSIAIEVEPDGTQGVMMIIDPQERFPPQVVILQAKNSQVVIHPAFSASADTADGQNIPLSQQATSTVRKVVVDILPKQLEGLGKSSGLIQMTGLAAKALNDSGVPLGKYADKFGIATKERLLSRDEAAAEFWQNVRQGAKEKAFFFTDPEFIASAGREGIPSAQGVAIDLASFYFDANAIFSCGYGNERVAVTESGPFVLYGCRSMTMGEQTAGLFRVAPEGFDERGLPLSKGSLQLISKSHVGLGFEAPLDAKGVTTISVPPGTYEAQVTNPGYLAAFGDIGVGSGDMSSTSYQLTPVFKEESNNQDHNNVNDNGENSGGSGAVHVTVVGSGTVTSRDGVIDCPGMCSGTLTDEFPFLSAEPSDGWYIAGWEGTHCDGSYYSCALTPSDLQSDIHVTVTFGRYVD
jgi:hypothetical protein